MSLPDSATRQAKATGHPYAQSDSDELIARISKLIYDSSCMIAHDWKAEDLIIVDNWQTLHGRVPMTENSKLRQLRRVQVF